MSNIGTRGHHATALSLAMMPAALRGLLIAQKDFHHVAIGWVSRPTVAESVKLIYGSANSDRRSLILFPIVSLATDAVSLEPALGTVVSGFKKAIAVGRIPYL